MAKLALLPGWGLGHAPLRRLAEQLAQYHEVSLHPLPALPLNEALQQLEQEIASDSWLLGWSLGGMVATALAARRQNTCSGLITLASNPCFVAREDWPQAMPPAEFSLFQRRAQRNWSATMQGFWALCTEGEASSAWPAVPATSADEHLPSLGWLAELDNRKVIRNLLCPQLHVLAVADGLVPASVAGPLARLNARAKVQTLAGSHAFVFSQTTEVAECIRMFIQQSPSGAEAHV